jgi:hypothetical protein
MSATFVMLFSVSMLVPQGQSAHPMPMPRTEAEEVTLALSAAPEPLRAGAGVFVLGSEGYRRARPATNGLTCLVDHDRSDTFEPICWDDEGAATIMPVAMDRAKWRAEGAPADEIERRVHQRFADGTYRAPRRAGVAYMLSAHNYVFNGERVIHFSPHVMLYAPYLTNRDIGSSGNDPNLPWVLNEGSPHAYIIIVTKAP